MKFRKAKWTKNKPVVEGWYWAIADYNELYSIEIVNVITSTGKLCALSTEIDQIQDLDQWDYWLGPLEQPEPPEGFLNYDD